MLGKHRNNIGHMLNILMNIVCMTPVGCSELAKRSQNSILSKSNLNLRMIYPNTAYSCCYPMHGEGNWNHLEVELPWLLESDVEAMRTTLA